MMPSRQTIPLPTTQMLSFKKWRMVKNSNMVGKISPCTCSHCRYKGHTAEKCYNLHGYPPGFHSKNKAAPVANQVYGPFIHGTTDTG